MRSPGLVSRPTSLVSTRFTRSRWQSGREIHAQCIIENREPEPSGWEGLADVRVMRAILESARTGSAVELTPFERRMRPDRSQEIAKPPLSKQPTVHAPSPTMR